MLDILAYTMLRVGDASRFGPPHLKKIIKEMAFQIVTEKSQGRTTVTVPIPIPNWLRACGPRGRQGSLGKKFSSASGPATAPYCQ
jgi:hypothetical protein